MLKTMGSKSVNVLQPDGLIILTSIAFAEGLV